MILLRADAVFASSISKFLLAIDREDFYSSNDSTISTSLIHNTASDGKSEQVVTWFLNLIFQHENGGKCRAFIELKLRELQPLLTRSDSRILNWYKLVRASSGEILVIDNEEFHPMSYRIPEHYRHEE